MSKAAVMKLNDYLPGWIQTRKTGGLYFLFVGPYMLVFCKRKRRLSPYERARKVKVRLLPAE